MSGRGARKRIDRTAKIILVLLFAGGVPFLFIHRNWAYVLLKAYLLTVGVFFVLLYAYWESIKEQWFQKAMVPFSVMHLGITLTLVKLNHDFPQIDRLPRMAYAALTWVAFAEVLIGLFIIKRFRPRGAR